VAGNYYPVNAMIAVRDDAAKQELAVLTDATQGGSSLRDGEIELMVHRRIQDDDHRGVQEPLNETMCGCNDIGAPPHKMGAHGHEGDGGCDCQGLTMRGRHWVVLDTIDNANRLRRQLTEKLSFPSTLAFAKSFDPAADGFTPTFSALGQALPPNVKLTTLTSNYASWNGGALLLRLTHLYAVGEHPTLAQPVTVNLGAVFAKAGLKIRSAEETQLTGTMPSHVARGRRHQWDTVASPEVAEQLAAGERPAPHRAFDPTTLSLTIRPMEVRTLLAHFD